MAVQQVTGLPLAPDLVALAVNAGVLMAFIGAIVVGVLKGLKQWRELKPPTNMAAATIMENITLSDWSASNKDVHRALIRVCEAIDALHGELNHNTDELRAVRRRLEELPSRSSS